MYPVLTQEEEAVQVANEDLASFPVEVTVLADGKFVESSGENYWVEERSIHLVGSGGTPREFVVNFQLTPAAVQAGYTFADPALKFFVPGSSRTAGFRVSPRSDKISVSVTPFNTKTEHDGQTTDEFSVFIKHPLGKTQPHDPSILWEPPIT